MANVFLVGLEGRIALDIASAISDQHTVFRRPHTIEMPALLRADIIFAGGSAKDRLSLLRRVRLLWPALPLVMVPETPDMEDWLDALEAGVTDYCCSPFVQRQIQRLIESLVPIRLERLKISFPRPEKRRPRVAYARL
jgi:DNA-binding response OmpR family regulator